MIPAVELVDNAFEPLRAYLRGKPGTGLASAGEELLILVGYLDRAAVELGIRPFGAELGLRNVPMRLRPGESWLTQEAGANLKPPTP